MQQRAQRSRQAILLAARDEFSSKGFHGARVDVIAAKAEVNKQRIYANFTSKAGLFAAVLKESFETLVREEQQLLALTAQDIPQLPRKILACYLELHAKHPEFWRLLAWENLEGGRHSAALAGLQEPVFRHLGMLYAQGQQESRFHADVPFEAFLFNLLAVSYFMVSNQRTLKRSVGLELATLRSRKNLCDAIARQVTIRP